jgi:uracil-DNA glycosylase
VGQAPGTRVHETGIPWNDPSGDRLRAWLDVDRATFYDESRIAIIPTGLCYPGRKGSGDAPPRPECAPTWHPPLLALLPAVELILLVGRYARRPTTSARGARPTLAGTVHAFADEYGPRYLPLPHPSPRNQLWFRRHPWFEREVVPVLRCGSGRCSRRNAAIRRQERECPHLRIGRGPATVRRVPGW